MREYVTVTKMVERKLSALKGPFQNDFNQIINPGDIVVCVASSYSHSTRVFKGRYLGYYEGDRYSWMDRKSTTRRIPAVREILKPSKHWSTGEELPERESDTVSRLELGRIYKLDEMSKDDVMRSKLVNH